MAITIPLPRQSSEQARGKNPRCDRPWRGILGLPTWCVAALLFASCRERNAPTPTKAPLDAGAPAPTFEVQRYDTLAAALAAVVPPQTRVLAIGELHARSDRPLAVSALGRFTREALPGLAPRLAHLVLETWTPASACGEIAERATATVEAQVRRPASTRDELGELVAQSARLGVPAHAMELQCTDYQVLARGDDEAIAHMLDLTTAELTRLGRALLPRTTPRRPLVVLYGGAMHNDLAPGPGLEGWSYAAALDRESGHRFVEVDLLVPELALADPVTAAEPWAHLLGSSPQVQVVHRGERSYAVLLPSSAPSSVAPTDRATSTPARSR